MFQNYNTISWIRVADVTEAPRSLVGLLQKKKKTTYFTSEYVSIGRTFSVLVLDSGEGLESLSGIYCVSTWEIHSLFYLKAIATETERE